MSASMETDTSDDEFPGRWRDIQKLLTRGSPLAHPEFEPSEQVHTIFMCMHRLWASVALSPGSFSLKKRAWKQG